MAVIHRISAVTSLAVLWTLAVTTPVTAWPADCTPADITLSSQSGVDGFQADHGPCDRVAGALRISGSGISDLAGLSDLTAIGGSLEIELTDNLQDLSGLGGLGSVGLNIRIYGNQALLNIDALSGVTSEVDSLYIQHNPVLADIGGISSLAGIRNNLVLYTNAAITTLTDLPPIRQLGGDLWISHSEIDWPPSSLESLEGLESLERVDGNLSLGFLAITDLAPLRNLASVGGELSIHGNYSLTDCSELDSLSSVGSLSISRNLGLPVLDGFPVLSSSGDLSISHNTVLTDIRGFAVLSHIAGSLTIENNLALASVEGFSALTEIADQFRFQNNDTFIELDGFDAVTTVRSIAVTGNASIQSISGFEQVDSLPDGLTVYNNDSLTQITSFGQVAEMGDLQVASNERLVNIEALTRLKRIDGGFFVADTMLPGLDAFAGLEYVGGSVIIDGNDMLLALDALARLEYVGGNVSIGYNSSLHDCTALAVLLDPIDHGEPGPGPGPAGIPDVGGYVDTRNNPFGCNSVNEVLAGVPLLELNAGINDAWFNPATDGQGIFIVIFPIVKQVFLAWFTYDVERPRPGTWANLGDPGHRWITAQGTFENNQAVLDIWVTEGGLFDSPMPQPQRYLDGEILLEVENCDEASVTYDIPSIGQQGVVPLRRIVLDRVPLCYMLDQQTGGG